jgi:hypothetical protein
MNKVLCVREKDSARAMLGDFGNFSRAALSPPERRFLDMLECCSA